jgi:AcrR family transcriptional regulator
MRAPSHQDRSHRVDARRNRAVILRVADQAFAEETDTVPLSEIARRAGLGRATVYRHFPDRQALGIAVAAYHLNALRRAATERRSDGDSFRYLFTAVLRAQTRRRSLVRLFRALPEHHQRQYTDALLTALRPAFLRAQQQGRLREDLQIADLAVVLQMIEGAMTCGPARNRSEPVGRLVQALLDGLFVPAPANASCRSEE